MKESDETDKAMKQLEQVATETAEACTDYTAMKLSSSPEGDPTRSGFKTENAAWRYASRWFCKGCRHLRAVALTWKHRYGIEAGEAHRATYRALKDMVKKDLSYNRPHGFEFDIDRMFGDEFGNKIEEPEN